MYLYRLIYYSRAKNDPDTDQILEAARTINSKNFVTGALWFDGDFFLQALEGGRSTLSETFKRIVGDKRHHDVVILGSGPIEERLFGDWDMGFYHDSKENRSLMRRFASQDFLDPRSMMPETALKMLKGVNLTSN